jgi:hypothetical protein
MAKKLSFDAAVQKYAKLIDEGVYRVYEEEVEEILKHLQAGKELTTYEWQDLSFAFFEKIYRDFSEDVFKEAVQIKRNEKLKASNKASALALIKLYKENK